MGRDVAKRRRQTLTEASGQTRAPFSRTWPSAPWQGCIKLSILSLRGTSGERTDERKNQQKEHSLWAPLHKVNTNERAVMRFWSNRSRSALA